MNSIFSRSVGVGDPLPKELELLDVATLMAATYQDPQPNVDLVREVHNRLYGYIRNGFLNVSQRIESEGTNKPLGTMIFRFNASNLLGGGRDDRITKSRQQAINTTPYRPEQNFVASEAVNFCLMKTDDPMKDAPGVRAWISVLQPASNLHAATETPNAPRVVETVQASAGKGEVNKDKKQPSPDFSRAAWFEVCLPPVMDGIASYPAPSGEQLCKVQPYFAVTDVLKVLVQLSLLGTHEVEQGESVRKGLSKALGKLGYVFPRGRPVGSDDERDVMFNLLVARVKDRLGDASLEEIRLRRA